jgi:hypothetical protein
VDKLQTGAVNLETTRLYVADLDGSGRDAILLVGQNDFHILRPGMPRVALRSIASYESPARNGRLENVEVGDLRGDGRPQIIVTDGTKQLMELLTWRKEEPALRSSAATAGVEEPRIQRALAWPVFEAKSFPGARIAAGNTDTSEPREYAVGKVTGDAKGDIVLLIHDRILIYRQE